MALYNQIALGIHELLSPYLHISFAYQMGEMLTYQYVQVIMYPICTKQNSFTPVQIKSRSTAARCLSRKRPLITDKQTNFVDRQTDGCYQFYYLPALLKLRGR